MNLITAAEVKATMADVKHVVGVGTYVFASVEDEAHFIATASDIEVVRYAGAIAYAADGKVDKESAKKFAKNRGFLSGLMMKIWNTLKSPGSILKIGAVAGSIALVGTALTFAAKNPAQFGVISKKFADKAGAWCAQVGQLAAKAIAAGKKSGGKIKGFVLDRLAGVIARLKTLPALLQSGAQKGAQLAKQGAQRVGQVAQQGAKKAGDVARQGAMRAGGVAHRAADAVQQGARKASNTAFKAGVGLEGKAPGAARALQRASGTIVKQGSNLAGGLRKAGTNVAMRAIPQGA